jgi:hypothetical protein
VYVSPLSETHQEQQTGQTSISTLLLLLYSVIPPHFSFVFFFSLLDNTSTLVAYVRLSLSLLFRLYSARQPAIRPQNKQTNPSIQKDTWPSTNPKTAESCLGFLFFSILLGYHFLTDALSIPSRFPYMARVQWFNQDGRIDPDPDNRSSHPSIWSREWEVVIDRVARRASALHYGRQPAPTLTVCTLTNQLNKYVYMQQHVCR